ncbi:putative ribonuclease H-like domain-containing protein [Tanacetum coccineum]
MTGSDDENTPPPPPTQQAPHTVSTIKLPILKKGEYDIWAMKMKHYLSHTDYPIWEVIQKGNCHSLPSQLEIHGAGVSAEDANQKFLRSLPSSWSQVSLVMRTKPGVDSLNFDDLYNNLRVFESNVKGSTGSSSSAQNVTFVSSESTSSTNDVSTAYGVSTSSGYNSQWENSSSYTDELMYSLFANQSSGPQLDHEDLEQLDEFDLEEMDLKWQVAMISMRLKKFYKKTGFNHLIRDCDFHEKRMAKQVELNKKKGKGTGQGENRLVWNNVQRSNHQNKFVPKAVLTKTGIFPVNTTRQNLSINSTNKYCMEINTAEVKAVSAVGDIRETVVKPSAGNKAYLVEYQDYNGGPIAFGGSKGYITGKGPEEANHSAGTQDNINAGNSKMEADPAQEYFVPPLWSSCTLIVKSSEAKNGDENSNGDTGPKTNEEPKDQVDQAFLEELERLKRQEKEANDAAKVFRKEFAQSTEDLLLQAGAARATSTNTVNTVSTPLSTANPSNVFSAGGPDLNNNDQYDSQIPALEDIHNNPSDGIFTNASYDDEGAVADFTNLETTVNVSPIPTSRIHSIHPTTQILRDPSSAVQTRSEVHKSSGAYAFVSYIQKQRRNNYKDFQHCLFACFLSQIKPKKISQALEDKNLPFKKKGIRTKWVYRNKKDERGVVVRNKARLVAQGYRQEEGIDYDEVFALMARIKAIRIFLAFASYMGFIVYQMDVKSAFLYGTINEEVYLSQPLGFVNPKFPKKV